MSAPDELARDLRDAAVRVLDGEAKAERRSTKAVRDLKDAVANYDTTEANGLLHGYVSRGIYDRTKADVDRLRRKLDDAGIDPDGE